MIFTMQSATHIHVPHIRMLSCMCRNVLHLIAKSFCHHHRISYAFASKYEFTEKYELNLS